MVGDGCLDARWGWRAVMYLCLVGCRLLQVAGAESNHGDRVCLSEHSVLCGAGYSALLFGQHTWPEDHLLTGGPPSRCLLVVDNGAHNKALQLTAR